jgi:hypothetical protein
MRGRVTLWLSLGINVALAAALWIVIVSRETAVPATTVYSEPPDPPVGTIRTNVVIRRQNFVWNQVESEDYPTYIANLRTIGCPEPTIRDIIVAEVNQLFARRRATEVVTSQHQWWRYEPDPEVTEAAIEQVQALENERRALLTRLLGPDWESADYPLPSIETMAPLDGPILGALPAETRLAVQRIERNAADRQQTYLSEQEASGRAPDPAELARLRRQTRAELAEVLDAEALEEYLLRHSQEARQLREQLRSFDASPEEFRAIFHALDPLDHQLSLYGATNDPVTNSRRQTLGQEKENALRQILTPERFDQYRLSQDPVYQQADDVARIAGAPPEAILPLAAVYRLTEMEARRIQSDATLSSEERADQLEAARMAHDESLRQLLGEEAYRRYLERQTQ